VAEISAVLFTINRYFRNFNPGTSCRKVLDYYSVLPRNQESAETYLASHMAYITLFKSIRISRYAAFLTVEVTISFNIQSVCNI
jgi:hypothetical protein